MILTPHIVISGILGSKTQNYFLAALIGLISHYVLDATPHWEYIPDGKTAIDILVGFGLLFILTGFSKIKNPVSLLIGAFFGILPDFLNFLYFITDWGSIAWNYEFQEFIHFSVHSIINPGFWPGILTQIAAIIILFFVSRKI
jgi:hypothetical protein